MTSRFRIWIRTSTYNKGEFMEAIVETGFKGYVGQEFIPKKDALTSLTEAVEIYDV